MSYFGKFPWHGQTGINEVTWCWCEPCCPDWTQSTLGDDPIESLKVISGERTDGLTKGNPISPFHNLLRRGTKIFVFGVTWPTHGKNSLPPQKIYGVIWWKLDFFIRPTHPENCQNVTWNMNIFHLGQIDQPRNSCGKSEFTGLYIVHRILCIFSVIHSYCQTKTNKP